MLALFCSRVRGMKYSDVALERREDQWLQSRDATRCASTAIIARSHSPCCEFDQLVLFLTEYCACAVERFPVGARLNGELYLLL